MPINNENPSPIIPSMTSDFPSAKSTIIGGGLFNALGGLFNAFGGLIKALVTYFDYHQASDYPRAKLTIIGGGISGALEAYFAYREAKEKGERIRITVYERNATLSQTTAANIVPSLTPDEILAVIPRGKLLVEKLGILFNLPGGIRVDDVIDVNNSESALKFIEQVQHYSKDDGGHAHRTQVLMELGKKSMDMWQEIYDQADEELKAILVAANFNPCREINDKDTRKLHDGYRIDLLNVSSAYTQAIRMRDSYQELGYKNCTILSPEEVIELDPYLSDFCMSKSTKDNQSGKYIWNEDAVALYRPGGCIDTEVFLPKFYEYLTKMMGKYISESGEIKDCLHIKFNRKVTGVSYKDERKTELTGISFFSGRVKNNHHQYKQSDYVFCPGEAVGTLNSLGFIEPAYSGFAGAALMINIPIPAEQVEFYKNFNHCMEVHQEGVVLAWQARFRNNQIFIGVAGTKAFYGDKQPDKHQDFAKDRNLLQLNIVNDVLPEMISLALGKDTRGKILTKADMQYLEDQQIAKRWVGTRAVAYDGFPTVGSLYNQQGKVNNARCTTHLGSGGVSFSPAAVFASRNAEHPSDPLIEEVVNYGDSRRRLGC